MKLSDFSFLTFDVYGTLINWEHGILRDTEKLAARTSLALTNDDVLEAHAFHESEAQAQIPTCTYARLLAIVYKRLAEEWEVHVSWDECIAYGNSVATWPTFEDTTASLHYLKQHFRLGVLTNTENSLFQHSVRHIGVEFDAVFTAEDTGAYKPNLTGFEYMLRILQRRGIDKSQILHVAESMFHDHGPANKMGMKSCHIFRRKDKPGFGATRVPDSMPTCDFRFSSLAEFVSAHAKEIGSSI